MIRIFAVFAMLFGITNCYCISVGESYGGGTVFCVTDDPDLTKCKTEGSGNFGLIMSNEDLANLDSPNKGITLSKKYSATNAQSEDDGVANTLTIINKLPNDDVSNNAAYLCNNYKNKTGWYLPSRNELYKMYTYAKANKLIGRNCDGSKAGGVQCLIGGDSDQYRIYWSSTEDYGDPSNFAWLQMFSGGNQNYGVNKTLNYFGVRAIRVFNSLALQPFNTLEVEKKHGNKQRIASAKNLAEQRLKQQQQQEEQRQKEMEASQFSRNTNHSN